MRKSILLFLIIMSAFPCLVLAEIDTDLRFKLGSATGSDRIEIGNTIGHGQDDYGTNAQAEAVLSSHRDSRARFILGLGLFKRQHPGEIESLSIPIKMDYSVLGMSIAPGVRFRINDSLNIEGKIEVGISNSGKVTLDSPGIGWNDTKRDDYASVSLIIGCYYLLGNSASKIGLEVGYQEFEGDFQIWSNSGNWSGGNVSGTHATVNLIYGIQF